MKSDTHDNNADEDYDEGDDMEESSASTYTAADGGQAHEESSSNHYFVNLKESKLNESIVIVDCWLYCHDNVRIVAEEDSKGDEDGTNKEEENRAAATSTLVL